MAKDINKTAFDEATKLKLNIFGECFEEWLPVFNNNLYTDEIYIYDLFAGSGKDPENTKGSPLVLFDKAKGIDRKYCLRKKKKTKFIFNELMKDKSEELEQNIKQYLEQCKHDNDCEGCVYRYKVSNSNFKDFFSDKETLSIFENNRIGKFILLDQYGFKQIDEEVFKQLISFPKTDFIFFISSSFISRFREHENTKKYFDTSRIDFNSIQPKEVHRAVTNYFKDLIPSNKEYYLHQFSIQKEENKSNYYGLIFGTNHTLGMEKFLKVCWRHDEMSGEANYNIDNNHERGTLFFQPENTIKKTNVSEEIKELILLGKIKDNITGLKFAISNGCEPILFTEAIKELESNKMIERIGDKNNQSANIHRAPLYKINVLKT